MHLINVQDSCGFHEFTRVYLTRTQTCIADTLQALTAFYKFTCEFFACTIQVVTLSKFKAETTANSAISLNM